MTNRRIIGGHFVLQRLVVSISVVVVRSKIKRFSNAINLNARQISHHPTIYEALLQVVVNVQDQNIQIVSQRKENVEMHI